MQQLICPTCGRSVSADNINIQKMTAVCAECDTVFRFDTPDAATTKAKRRKVKQPQHLDLHDGDTLRMAFRTNWRLDRDSDVIGALSAASAMFLIFGLSLSDLTLDSSSSIGVPLIFMAIFLAMLYRLGLRLYNKTHLDMDEQTIQVSRQPLPSLSNTQNVSLSGVTKIVTEETKASIENEYDTPRFAIWAERADGTRRMIVTDLVEEYAYFVMQQLDQQLHAHDYLDTTRLIDDDNIVDEAIQDFHLNKAQQKHVR